MSTLVRVLVFLIACFRSRAALQMQNTMLRHQLNVYQRRQTRPRLLSIDCLLWAWFSRICSGWCEALTLVKPATVTAWQRKRFGDHWAALSHRRGPGRPPVAKEVQDLIEQLSGANIGLRCPTYRGELRKLGIQAAKSTVEKYRVKHPKLPSPRDGARATREDDPSR